MRVEQAIDEVQAARPTGTRAERQVARQEGFGARGKTAGLLVADVDPTHIATANRIGDEVQRITRHAVATLRAGRRKRRNDYVGYLGPAHVAVVLTVQGRTLPSGTDEIFRGRTLFD
jgi:hypothetical protein